MGFYQVDFCVHLLDGFAVTNNFFINAAKNGFKIRTDVHPGRFSDMDGL
jgi:hypothetical protein